MSLDNRSISKAIHGRTDVMSQAEMIDSVLPDIYQMTYPELCSIGKHLNKLKVSGIITPIVPGEDVYIQVEGVLPGRTSGNELHFGAGETIKFPLSAYNPLLWANLDIPERSFNNLRLLAIEDYLERHHPNLTADAAAYLAL